MAPLVAFMLLFCCSSAAEERYDIDNFSYQETLVVNGDKWHIINHEIEKCGFFTEVINGDERKIEIYEPCNEEVPAIEGPQLEETPETKPAPDTQPVEKEPLPETQPAEDPPDTQPIDTQPTEEPVIVEPKPIKEETILDPEVVLKTVVAIMGIVLIFIYRARKPSRL